MAEILLNLNVLIVDDNKISTLLLQKALSKWGVNSDVAENGVDALAKIKNNRNYDVVLMDVNMPQMGGIETSRIIRANPGQYYQNLPIIALTASSISEIDEIYLVGMNDHILKPFDTQSLFNKLIQYKKV